MSPDVLLASAERATTAVARPLRVLVPLIQQDLREGREAVARAGMPYFQAAGEKLLEAKTLIPHGEFTVWVIRNFTISDRQARVYMRLAEAAAQQNGSALPFCSLRSFVRETRNQNSRMCERVWREAARAAGMLNPKRDERKAQRALGLQIIDIGYKALVQKLHPDKGGSPEAMARLNAERERLKAKA